MSSTSSPCSCKDKEMMELRQNNERLHLTTCSLISQNKQLSKSSKELRQKLIVSKRKLLTFKIDQTKKYHVLLQTNMKLMSEHETMKKCVDDMTEKNKKLKISLENVMDTAVKGVKATALCDGIDFNVNDFSIDEMISIENETELTETSTNETDPETPKIIDSSNIPSTPPDSNVDKSLIIDNNSDEPTPKKPVSGVSKRKRSESTVNVRKSNRIRKKKNNL